jgi:hypothetical protein
MTTTTLRLRGTDAREDFDRGPGIMRRGLAMRAEDLLDHAAWVVRHRRRTYGQPNDVFGHVAKRWSLVLGIDVTPAQAIRV